MSYNFQAPVYFTEPYHALIFENGSESGVTVWIALNGEWHVTPVIAPSESLLPILIPQSMRVEWRAVSSGTIIANNLANGTQYDAQAEAVIFRTGLVHWRGRFKCKRGMLGTHTRVTFY